MRISPLAPRLLVALALAALLAPGPAAAQFDLGDLGLGGFGGEEEELTGDPVTLDAQFTAATADRPAVLMLTAKIQPGWHVYSITQPKGGPQRTKIDLPATSDYRLIGPFAATPAFKSHIDNETWAKPLEIQEHDTEVTWYAPVELAEGVAPSAVVLRGTVRLQACKQVCLPLNFDFAAERGDGVPIGPITLSQSPTTATSTVATPTADASPAADPAAAAPTIGAAATYDLAKIQFDQETSLGYNLMLAFFGGLALNLMPCVLPVIGLKVMSFVAQAGKSRWHAFALNGWYAAGILAVFLVLATLAVTIGYSWGDQAGRPAFNILMATIVTAMGLSLLGVWEIPIPGFLGSNTTQQAISKEGSSGAFLKGVVTTMLAIPCTGPGMAVALGWAVGKPDFVVFAIFTAIGLGMASPYLVIGAFPGLVKFLPKPGAWMESFKQLMGFVLMGTVVFLLSLLPTEYVLPTLAMLCCTGLACWVYAGTPLSASSSERWQSYALCGAILAGGGVMSFMWMLQDVTKPRLDARIAAAATQQLNNKLAQPGGAEQLAALIASGAPAEAGHDGAWAPFSLAKLQQLAVERGQTVMVDFGAEWCVSCKTFEKTVLHTEPVDQAIERAGVATLYADYTEYPPEIKATLDGLRSQGVPVVAIFPGDDPYRPVVFRGGYTQGQLIEAINQATGQAAGGGSVEKVASNH